MRKTGALLLAALGLLSLPPLVSAQPASDARAHRTSSHYFSFSERRTAPVTLTWSVELERDKKEWRTSRQAAREEVLLKAQEKLGDWLQRRHPYSTFVPSLDFIQRHVAVEGVEVSEEDVVDGEQRYSAKLKLKLTPDVQRMLYNDIDKHMMHMVSTVAWDRQWLLAKGLLFILAVAAALAGFYHLDDRFQGYYSKPLGTAAWAAVAVASYGILLLP